jgi:deoxycytidine triphosphate deaminase
VSKVISGKRLQDAVSNNVFLSGGDISNCDGIKYDFRLGDRILKSKYRVPINYSDIPVEKQGTDLVVSPGEMVFVMTKETLNLPKNIFSQLSPRRKMTEFGVITLGGLAIDPGYNGKLLFGLYNISSEDFKLIPNAKLAGAVFFELVDDELLPDYIPPKAVLDYSSNLIEKIVKYQPIGITTLEESIRKIEDQLEVFKKGLSRNTDAVDELEKLMHKTSRNIERISDDIGNLSNILKLEKEAREKGFISEAQAREKISKVIDTKIATLKGALWLATAVGTALVGILIAYLIGLLKP